MSALAEVPTELSTSLLFMERLFEDDRVALAAIDGDFRIVLWSPAMEALTGIPAARAVGSVATEVVPAIRVTGDYETMQRALMGAYSESRTRTPFGVSEERFSDLETFCCPLCGPRGPIGALVVVRESQEGTRIREQLEEAEARFRTMANCAPVLLWMSDTNALCTFFNQTWLSFTGRTLEEEKGYGWACGIHPEDFEACVSTYMTCFSTREAFSMVYRLRRHDGAFRWILDSGAPRYTSAGRFAGFIGSCVDITEQKMVEQSLEETAASLRAARDQMETLLHAASHDLREPLRMVGSYVGLLEIKYGSVLDADGQKFVRYAVEGARRMRDLIDGLLTFAGVRDIDREEFGVVSLQEVFEMARANLDLMIRENGATVTGKNLPAVRGATRHLARLLQNLLENALKFRSERSPLVEVWAERLREEWIVHVRDNGIGLPQEYSEKAFMLLGRLHRHDEYPGSGIGLTLCREIVQRHGGKITLSSVVGTGTTVSFTMPITDP